MSLQKQKYILRSNLRNMRFRPMDRHVASRLIRLSEPVAVVVMIFVLIVGFQPTATYAPARSARGTTITTTATKPKPQPKKAAEPKPAAQKPASKPAAPAPAPSYVAPAPAGTSKVEPVVRTSPRSNVSGLKPTSPSGKTKSGSGSGSQVTSGYTSLNWSGYMAASGTFTSVSASWNATRATGNGSSTTADSTWIGIGGVSSDDLIQVGTQNTISAGGRVTSSAFYEMLPDYALTVPGVTVTEGDSITASLSQISSGTWSISLTDNTDHESWNTTVSYASSLSSAEWIEEDPSYSYGRLVPFDNFGAAYFTGGRATMNGSVVDIAASTAQPVIMVNDSGTYIAVPSVIGGDGASFSVTP